MTHMRLRYALSTVAVICVGVLIFSFIQNTSLTRHICGVLPFGHDYLCFAQSMDAIYTEEGAESSFVYLNGLSTQLNYGASHLIAHQLGHALWEDTNDLKTALDQIPYEAYSPTEIFRYGGVVHGVFHSYFLAHSDTSNIKDLVRHSCDVFTQDEQEALWTDCTHGIGHGLMAYTNNDIGQTLELCKESISPENCYSGAYMERGLLFIPGYANVSNEESLILPCAANSGPEYTACAQYTGWTAIVKELVQTRSSNTATALQACDVFTDTLLHDCIFVAVRDLFSIVYDNDMDTMQNACLELKDVQACQEGITAWNTWDSAYRGGKEETGV